MRTPYLLLAAFLFIGSLATPGTALAAPHTDDLSDFTPLSNKDVLVMVERRVETDVIVQAIKSSPCTFDTFPPVLRELKRRGVPEEVLQAMVEAPYGPSENKVDDSLAQQPIYHYIEQLKQMGFLAPTTSGRRRVPIRQNRARATRPRQR